MQPAGPMSALQWTTGWARRRAGRPWRCLTALGVAMLLAQGGTGGTSMGGAATARAGTLDPQPTLTPAQRLAIPSYFYPGALWQQLDAAAPRVGLAIINPASGPGTTLDPAYAQQVQQSQASGVTVVGYVHTSYGTRSLADVEAEITDYVSWYGVNGIFVDEASTDCTVQPYYLSLHSYIQAQRSGATVIINPGTHTHQCYMATAEIVVTFEGDYTTYRDAYVAAPWTRGYAPQRFWHLVYATPSIAAMYHAMGLSQQRRAGWVYVTPDTLPNPWDTLPTNPYWRDELAALR